MTVIKLPEINFITTNVDEIVSDSIQMYEHLAGRKLADADPIRLILLAHASIIVQQNVKINDAAKQNLLYYARDDVLKHKGAEWNTPYLVATKARAILRLYMTQPLITAKIIPAKTLVTFDGQVFFASLTEVTCPIGTTQMDVEIECTTPGVVGNNFGIGQLNILVKPLEYVERVENITVSSGGAEAESDDDYRARIYQAPEQLSTAGPTGAYEYHAKKASTLVADVKVKSPTPGTVHISVIEENGRLPSDIVIHDIIEAVNDRRVRPLTDYVTVSAPEIKVYNLDITYYIDALSSDKMLIQKEIEAAIDRYIVWQSSKIGRDINPSQLTAECVAAGAKRVDIRSPIFTVIADDEVAHLNTQNVVFGGEEIA